MTYEGRKEKMVNVPKTIFCRIAVYFHIVNDLIGGKGGEKEKIYLRDLYREIYPWICDKEKRMEAREQYHYSRYYAAPHDVRPNDC